MGRRLDLLLKAEVVREMTTESGTARDRLLDNAAMVLDQAITNVALRHAGELDPLALHDEITEEFRRVVRVWTADHPEPERTRGG